MGVLALAAIGAGLVAWGQFNIASEQRDAAEEGLTTVLIERAARERGGTLRLGSAICARPPPLARQAPQRHRFRSGFAERSCIRRGSCVRFAFLDVGAIAACCGRAMLALVGDDGYDSDSWTLRRLHQLQP